MKMLFSGEDMTAYLTGLGENREASVEGFVVLGDRVNGMGNTLFLWEAWSTPTGYMIEIRDEVTAARKIIDTQRIGIVPALCYVIVEVVLKGGLE